MYIYTLQKNNFFSNILVMNNDNVTELLHIYTEPIIDSTIYDANTADIEGSFEKKILILIQNRSISEEDRTMFSKLLDACSLSVKDCYILYTNNEFAINSIISYYKPEKVILFGLNISNTSFQVQKEMNKPFIFNNISFVQTADLHEVRANTVLKSALWNHGLKPLFVV